MFKVSGYYSEQHCVKVSVFAVFWSVFSRIRDEYGEIWSISPYSVQMQENTDQKNSEYRYFSRIGKKCLVRR